MNINIPTNNHTLILTSHGGGGHKAVSTFIEQNEEKQKRNTQVVSAQLLESSTHKVSELLQNDASDALAKTDNAGTRFFNWCQKNGYSFLINIMLFLNFIFEFLFYYRVKYNTLQTLRKYGPSKICVVQPIHIPAIHAAIEEYAKEQDLDYPIEMEITATDFLSKNTPFWSGIKKLPLVSDYVNVTVKCADTEGARRLKIKSAPRINWNMYDSRSFSNFAPCDVSNPTKDRVVFMKTGIKWEDANIEQAKSLPGISPDQLYTFNKKLSLRPSEKHIVATLGSQGSVSMGADLVRWFNTSTTNSDTRHLIIFAGRAYNETVEKISRILPNTQDMPIPNQLSDDIQEGCAQKQFKVNNSVVTVVDFCNSSTISNQLLKSDLNIIKASGLSVMGALSGLKTTPAHAQAASSETLTPAIPIYTGVPIYTANPKKTNKPNHPLPSAGA
ncbi:MAG: hypothetical protein VXW87_00705 [Pseudomonadota bacterium]|nr:hypothetical protein [Pseudomonadota bacterium]